MRNEIANFDSSKVFWSFHCLKFKLSMLTTCLTKFSMQDPPYFNGVTGLFQLELFVWKVINDGTNIFLFRFILNTSIKCVFYLFDEDENIRFHFFQFYLFSFQFQIFLLYSFIFQFYFFYQKLYCIPFSIHSFLYFHHQVPFYLTSFSLLLFYSLLVFHSILTLSLWKPIHFCSFSSPYSAQYNSTLRIQHYTLFYSFFITYKANILWRNKDV